MSQQEVFRRSLRSSERDALSTTSVIKLEEGIAAAIAPGILPKVVNTTVGRAKIRGALMLEPALLGGSQFGLPVKKQPENWRSSISLGAEVEFENNTLGVGIAAGILLNVVNTNIGRE
jgi:hypothetical protein